MSNLPTGPGDPRLTWAVWADESAKADGGEAAQARGHRDQDRLAAAERAGRRGGLLGHLKRLLRRG